MIKSNGNIVTVKDEISKLQGKDVLVSVNLGRNKTAKYMAKLSGVYTNIFTVSPYGEFRGKTSFSYAEIISKNVILTRQKLDNDKYHL